MPTLYELKDKILELNDIVDLVGEYVTLKKAGSTYSGKCPFHGDKTPSFYVWPKTQTFFCFGCGKGGNSITFVMEIEKLSFKDSLEFLARRQNIEFQEVVDSKYAKRNEIANQIYELNKYLAIYFYNNLKSSNGANARNYLSRRKLSLETVVKFGLGYSLRNDSIYSLLKNKKFSDEVILKSGLVSSKNRGDIFRGRIMFPIFNEVGKIVGFGGRTLTDEKPKYLNTAENEVFNKRRNLYGLNFAKHSKLDGIILVEGYMDVIALHQAGVDNACASLGTALTNQQVTLLKKYSNDVTICYDSDNAGKMAAYRASDMIKNDDVTLKVFLVPNGKDPDEFMKTHQKEEFINLLKNNSLEAIDYKTKHLKQKYSFDSDSDKIKYIDEVLTDVINDIDSEIKKELYIKKISKEFLISEESIVQKLDIINSKKNQKEVNNNINLTDTIVTEPEKIFLKIILENSSLIEKIKSLIKIEYFYNKNYKLIAGIIFKLVEQNKKPTMELVSSEIPEEKYSEISAVLADILNSKIIYDLSDDNAIKEIAYKIQKNYLEQNLKIASKNSDWESMKIFGEKLNKLSDCFSRKE